MDTDARPESRDRLPLSDGKRAAEDALQSPTLLQGTHTGASEILTTASFVGNILWLVFGGGLVFGLQWLLDALLCALTIIGLPVAVGCWRLGAYALWPLGREPIDKRSLYENMNPLLVLAAVLWLPFGFFMALGHVIVGVLLCVTVLGLPFGIAHFKIARVALCPYAVAVVPRDVARQIRALAAQHQLDFRLKYAHLSKQERLLLNIRAICDAGGLKVLHWFLLPLSSAGAVFTLWGHLWWEAQCRGATHVVRGSGGTLFILLSFTFFVAVAVMGLLHLIADRIFIRRHGDLVPIRHSEYRRNKQELRSLLQSLLRT